MKKWILKVLGATYALEEQKKINEMLLEKNASLMSDLHELATNPFSVRSIGIKQNIQLRDEIQDMTMYGSYTAGRNKPTGGIWNQMK